MHNDMVSESIMLGRITGIFILILGFSLLSGKRDWMMVVEKARDNPTVLYLAALLELAAGLIVASIHPIWTTGWPVLITIFGWLMIVEAVLYLFLPNQLIIRILGLFNRPAYLNICGFTLVVIGLYMTAMSFGLAG